jgi:hypothetical protein
MRTLIGAGVTTDAERKARPVKTGPGFYMCQRETIAPDPTASACSPDEACRYWHFPSEVSAHRDPIAMLDSAINLMDDAYTSFARDNIRHYSEYAVSLANQGIQAIGIAKEIRAALALLRERELAGDC